MSHRAQRGGGEQTCPVPGLWLTGLPTAGWVKRQAQLPIPASARTLGIGTAGSEARLYPESYCEAGRATAHLHRSPTSKTNPTLYMEGLGGDSARYPG